MLIADIPKHANIALLQSVSGVELHGSKVHFSQDIDRAKAAHILDLCTEGTARFETASKGFEPTAEDKQIVTAMGVDVPMEELTFRELRAANSKLDRDRDRFTSATLEKFAQIINHEKTAIAFMHNPALGILAKAISARVETDADGTKWLLVKVFIDNQAMIPGGTGLSVVRGVKSKYLDHVSVTFRAPSRIEESGDMLVRVFDSAMGGDTDLSEISFVHLGAQRDARSKSFKIDEVPKSIEMKKSVNIGTSEKPLNVNIEVNGDQVTASAGDDMQQLMQDAAQVAELRKQVTELLEPVLAEVEALSRDLEKSWTPDADLFLSWDSDQRSKFMSDLRGEHAQKFPKPAVKGTAPTADDEEEEQKKEIRASW